MKWLRYLALASSLTAVLAGPSALAAEEGDPEFDYPYGKTAYLAGNYHEAMFALERVVYAQPENMQARYLLAKTYNAMGNHEAAQREFKIVQANNPPTDIAEDVNRHLSGLQAANKKSSMIGQVEAFVGHDDNINRATGDSFIGAPFFSPIAPTARQQSDMYRQVGGHVQYFQPLSEGYGVVFKGGVSDKDFFSSDDFDETILNGGATLNKKYEGDTLRLGVNLQSYQLSGSTYTVNRAIEGSWYHETGEGHGVSAGLNYNESDYPSNGLFNVDQYAAHAAVHRRYGNQYHVLTFMTTDERADESAGDYNARDTLYLFYDFNLYINARNAIQSRLLYSETERDAQDPAFVLNRDDDFLGLTLTWQWRYDQQLMVVTRLGISDNDSDISTYEYERRYLETGVRYTF